MCLYMQSSRATPLMLYVPLNLLIDTTVLCFPLTFSFT